MSKLEKIIKQIQEGYKELRQCEDDPIKKAIIGSIRLKCIEGLRIIDDDEGQVFANVNKRKHIETIKSKIDGIEKTIDEREEAEPKIGNGGRKVCWEEEGEHKTRIIKTIMAQEIKTMNLQLSEKELNQILKKMENNTEITKQINEMITKQGGNLEAVEKNIQLTYENMLSTNSQLDEAQRQQMHQIQKVRGAFSKTFTGVCSFIFKPFKYVFHDAWVKKNK